MGNREVQLKMGATTQRIIYTAKRYTTGLSDITVTIYDNAGSVAGTASMSELGNGLYYYDYTPSATGWFTWVADSTSQPQTESGSFLSDYSTVASTTTTTDYAGTAELLRFMGYTASNVPDVYTNTVLQEAIDRATAEINRYCKTKFVDSTATTPTWGEVTNEKKRGQGQHNRDYYSDYGPIASITATTSADIAASDSTISVDSTSGWPSNGTFLVGGNKVAYTGKTSTTFTGCTGVDEAVDSGEVCYPFVLEISTTEAGSDATWSVMENDAEMDCDLDAGRFHLFRDDFILDVYGSNNPPKIPNRARLSYMYGYDSIPTEIKRCCLMIAAKELMHITVHKAHGEGSDGFNPATINVDEDWIKNTLDSYRTVISSNV